VTALLEAEEVHVSYGHIEAVRGASLTLAAGQIVTVIGANGAGKTTLLSALMGLLPVRGRIRYGGLDVTALEVESRVERGMCLVPERRELFSAMNVADNLLLGGYVRRRQGTRVRDQLGEIWALFPHLAERRNQLAGTLSGGERQMLALGRALMSCPRLLLLDEPSLGLAPLVVRDIFRTITGLRASGVSILLVEQNARAALECADYAYLLENGEIRLDGPAATLLRDPRLASVYLGGDVG
jgi:branched-chain amino acid transport system ATP-binding protein